MFVVTRDDYYRGEEGFFGVIVFGECKVGGYCIVRGGIVIIGVTTICWKGLNAFCAQSSCMMISIVVDWGWNISHKAQETYHKGHQSLHLDLTKPPSTNLLLQQPLKIQLTPNYIATYQNILTLLQLIAHDLSHQRYIYCQECKKYATSPKKLTTRTINTSTLEFATPFATQRQ